MRNLLATAVVLATLGTAPAMWATEPPWAFMGLGASACPNFTVNVDAAKVDKEDYLLGFFSWAQGYMSALNDFLLPKKQLNGMLKTAQIAELYKYCMAHGDKTFSAAVVDLYSKLPEMPQQGHEKLE